MYFTGTFFFLRFVKKITRRHFLIDQFRVLKTLIFKMKPSAHPFLWKWVLFAWEWKIISISKAEHLTSFWYRGLGELGNGLFIFQFLAAFKGNKTTNKKVLQKDTAYIVEKHSVLQPAVITDLVEEFVKGRFLSRPTILQKNDHVTYKGVITSFCRQPLLKKKRKVGVVFYAVGNTVVSYCVEGWGLFRG